MIIMSGYGEYEIAQKAICYDVESYLLKPFNENQLINAGINT